MDILQIALVVLITIWTLIFVIIAVAIFLIFRAVKRAADKVNTILDSAEEIAENAKIPSKVAMAAVIGFLAKNSIEGIKGLVESFVRKKK